MNHAPDTPRRGDLLWLAALALLVFLPGIGSRDLWNPDEPRYAEVAYEMRASGNWLVPHLNGDVYTHKPPLLFWLIGAASYLTGGVNEVAARLPSALAAVGAILATYWLAGTLLGSRRGALLTALVFGSTVRLLWQGRVGQIDMLLGALVAVAVACWAFGYHHRRPGFYRLFFLFAGLATLAKGPVGLLPPLLGIVAFLLVTRDRTALSELRIPTGLLIWAAVVAAWLVPTGLLAGPEYLNDILFRQNLTRYADPWHHFQPFYYYLTTIPADFAPWTFLLPTAFWVGRKHLTGASRKAVLFGLCWVVVTVVFFSLSPAKRSVYVTTMFPGLALIVGAALNHLVTPGVAGSQRWRTVPFALVAALFAAITVALPWAAGRDAETLATVALLGEGFVGRVMTLTGLISLAAAIAAVLAARERLRAATAVLAAGMASAALLGFVLVVPRFNPLKTARPLAAELVARAAPHEPYTIYPRFDAPFVFYTRRWAEVVAGEAELQAFARRPGRVWVLIERDDFAKLATPLPLVEVARAPEPKQGYLLLTTPPAP